MNDQEVSLEIKAIDEAIEMGVQRGVYTRKQAVQLDHAIEVLKIQNRELLELREEVKTLRLKNEMGDFAKTVKKEADPIDGNNLKPVKHKGN